MAMADIELVIKLDKDIAQGIIDGENDEPRNIVRSFQATIADAIKNGTPLPKGHGRLIDADELKSHINRENYKGFRIRSDGVVAFKYYINNAPTIIEADWAESEG
jgi:hypothetical protein